MIVRCSGCNGALRWEPALQKMKCKYCESLYDVEELSILQSEKNTMKCKLFTCTACAATLAINDVEAATFCAYCGQPTIVFERVAKMKRPDKILPFKITREEAERAIRNSFQKGFLVPKAVKNFKTEHISGIYIPYRIYDITYSDKQTIRVSEKDTEQTFSCSATTHFREITEDASLNFCNESSRHLEPFDFGEQKAFHEAYLSGFYADCYDEKEETTRERALKQCKKLFDEELLNSLMEPGFKTVLKFRAKSIINRADYVLLPVWFLTLRYQDKPYTMLVNGQTGKVVGSVPSFQLKSCITFLSLLLLALMILPKFYIWLFGLPLPDDGDTAFSFTLLRIALFALPTLLFFAEAKSIVKRLTRNLKRTSDKKMSDFASDRQEAS